MKKVILSIVLILMLSVFGVFAASAQEDAPESPESEHVAVTVYNQGTALVRDQRTFNLQEGTNIVNFTDVAASIDATSVSFVSITDPDGTVVLEQNYVYDLVSSSALIEKFVDQTIEVSTDEDTTYIGKLLSGRDGNLILMQENGQVVIIQYNSIRDIRFPELPEGLITRPTLRWMIQSSQTGDQQVELTYLTGGMSWTADYNLLLTPENTALDLNGWVTLNNTSGTAYQDAQLKLVAGDVNRIQDEAVMREMMYDMAEAQAAPATEVAQREFFQYQLYEVNRPVTIGDNETKQVEFVSAAGVPANLFFVYDSSYQFYGYYSPISDQYYGQTGVTDVQNWLEFTTGEENGVGADLPAGRVRVYQEDTDGAALLIGENQIDHTPMGEDIQLYLGNAFDLVGERIQTRFEIVSRNVIQETYEIHLRNRKDDQAVEIRVPENLFRWSNWEVLDSSHEYTKLNASTIEYRVTVEPGEEEIITYTVQYSWR